MATMDTSQAWLVETREAFAAWLADHGATERETVVAIFKKASGKQTVTFPELLETAFCHGWVDVQTKSIDDERYAIRFVARRPGSTWSPRNRAIVAQLLAAGRMTPAGRAVLAPDMLPTGET
jgi:uncharacterized protein YdeI (YjbR/CyaY-like superfamily)